MRASAAIAAIVLLPASAHAASLKVYPVRVVLTPKDPVQTMTIQNSSSEPTRMQLRVFSWRQENGKDVFEETRDVLVNPVLAEIAPGAEQIARLGLRTTPGAVEKSYRIFLEEVPGSSPSQPGEVRTLLRISVPIFVPAPNAVGRITWRTWPGTDKVTFAIANPGTAHVQINRLTLKRTNGQELGGDDMAVYLLPGASQNIRLDVSAPVRGGEGLTVNAVTDQGNLTANLVAEPSPREVDRP